MNGDDHRSARLGSACTTTNLQIFLKNRYYLNQATPKKTKQIFLLKESWDQKFQTQKIPAIILITRNPKYPCPGMQCRSRFLPSCTHIKWKTNFFVKKLILFFKSNFYWKNAYTQMFAGGYKFFWLASTKTRTHFASTLIMNPDWHVLTKEDNIWSTCWCMYTLVN